MNSMQLLIAVYALPLDAMEMLAKDLPRQIRLRKLESNLQQGETSKAEDAVTLFGIEDKKDGRGKKASPNGAQSLIQRFLSEQGEGSRKEVHAFCTKHNPDLSTSTIDSTAQVLVKRQVMVKEQGTWKQAA